MISNWIWFITCSFHSIFRLMFFHFFFLFVQLFLSIFVYRVEPHPMGINQKIEEELIVRTACIKFMIYISDTRSIDGWSVNEVRSVLLHKTIIKLIWFSISFHFQREYFSLKNSCTLSSAEYINNQLFHFGSFSVSTRSPLMNIENTDHRICVNYRIKWLKTVEITFKWMPKHTIFITKFLDF